MLVFCCIWANEATKYMMIVRPPKGGTNIGPGRKQDPPKPVKFDAEKSPSLAVLSRCCVSKSSVDIPGGMNLALLSLMLRVD